MPAFGDVVVAAMRSPSGASAALLHASLDGRVQLVANVALILGYGAVCKRAEHLAATGLDIEQAGMFLDALAALAEPVDSHFLWRPQLKDPSDEMVLEAAVNGRAQVIVTFNLRDFAAVPEQFGLGVLLPRDALRRISKRATRPPIPCAYQSRLRLQPKSLPAMRASA